MAGLSLGPLGSGGAILIIPALVLVRGLPLSTAIGTSLGIITFHSATGC